MRITSAQTQRERLLEFLTAKGSKGAYVYELQAPRPQGLGLAQYNARIYELRRMGWNIKNIEAGHFVLIGKSLSKSTTKLNKKQRSELRSKEKQLAFFERVLANGIADENLVKRKESLESEINKINLGVLPEEEQAELLELNKNVQQTLLS